MSETSERVDVAGDDGFEFTAHLARPAGTPKAGLVIFQEIFGLTPHIQSVADTYAKEGYLCIAPSAFDRVERDVVLPYDAAGLKRGQEIVAQLDPAKVMMDVKGCVERLNDEGCGTVGFVGFCWGGSMAWMAAAQVPIQAAVGYYGRLIPTMLEMHPQCPVMLHFGADDASIPMSEVDKILAAHPEVPVHVYEDAGHAFNRDCDPKHFNGLAARAAKQRTLRFLDQHLVF